MVYLVRNDLVTAAARGLLTTWLDDHHGLPTGFCSAPSLCRMQQHSPLVVRVTEIGFDCLSSVVWFGLLLWWIDSQLALQIFNEEQTLFWSGTAEEQGPGEGCCFWQK